VKLRGADYALRTAGTLPSGNTVAVGLTTGWNAIGVPSLTNINVSELTFANPASTTVHLTFDQASSNAYHIVSPVLYKFVADAAGGHYEKVVESNVAEGSFDTFLMPWQGYWIKAFENTTLYMPTHLGASGSDKKKD
jgi:hypothetical protein